MGDVDGDQRKVLMKGAQIKIKITTVEYAAFVQEARLTFLSVNRLDLCVYHVPALRPATAG